LDSDSVESVSGLDILDPDSLRDAIMCESIKRAYGGMDDEVKKFTNAGATVNSLFLEWEGEERPKSSETAGKSSRPVRVFCANVGDSRCIMLRTYDTKTALSLPSCFEPRKNISSNNLEKKSIDNSEKKSMRSLHSSLEDLTVLGRISPSEVSVSVNSASMDDYSPRNSLQVAAPLIDPSISHSTPMKTISTLAPLSNPITPASRITTLTPLADYSSIRKRRTSRSTNFVVVHLMSEDHKLSLPRERARIVQKVPADSHFLPCDASPIYLPPYARTAPPKRISLDIDTNLSPRRASVLMLSPVNPHKIQIESKTSFLGGFSLNSNRKPSHGLSATSHGTRLGF
jgi:hypothetical protein